jgi:2-polyprenyl-3-methyl-5-hydroxy-6-metoxy-1,4-benzoquinol methylase
MVDGSHPFYVCPHDRSPLIQHAAATACSSCGTSFEQDDGIMLLDCVQRADRASFDASASKVLTLPAEQRDAAVNRARTFLEHAGIQTLSSARMLDVGCGLGDLTYGLSCCGAVTDCDIFAIDHSVRSLRVLQRSLPGSAPNRIHLSTQDVSKLCFPDEYFDLIVGSAVLHHILDYPSFLKTVYGLLRAGGKAVFAEPFLGGYLMPSLMLALAVDQLKISATELRRPQYGMCDFIIQDTAFRIRHEGDLSALDVLSDKHYFRAEQLSELACSIGFQSMRTVNYEPPAFYAGYMAHFMEVYGITDASLKALAMKYFDVFKGICGDKLAELVSHFKYIALTR